MKPFSISKPYLLSQKYNLIVYVLIILFVAAISIISPYIVGGFLDDLISGGGTEVILKFAIIFGGLNVVRILLGYISAMMNTKMQTKMGYSFNMDTIKHIQGLSLTYTNQKDSAYLNQKITNDVYALIAFCVSILQSILTNIVLLIIPFVILLSMNWFVAVLMIAFLVIYTILYFIFKKRLYKVGFVFREMQSKLFAKLHEQLRHIRAIKINSIQEQINKRADDGFEKYKGAVIHNQKVNYLYSGVDGSVSTIAQIVLFVIGGIQIINGNFTIGMFTIFTSYFGMMLGAMRYFFGLGAYYQNVLVSYSRVKDIFNQESESFGVQKIESISNISINNVSFSYPVEETLVSKHNRKAVSSLSVEFKKGQIYALKGANGAGKSTLVSLIMGLYIDEYSGFISYDKIDIRKIDMVHARRELIGFSEQEPILLNDSIWYNVCFNNTESHNNYKKLNYYVELLGMQNFISQNSFDFLINEHSNNTSGGEKQKISILKVLHKNPAVMILDEPTSALDIHSTKRFIEYLSKIKKDKIIIIITHDEAVSSACDEIINLS